MYLKSGFSQSFQTYLFVFLSVFVLKTQAQIAPGQWRDILPYRQGQRLAFGENKVYCSTSHSLFYYDLADNSINKISKVQGLSDNLFSTIAYAPKQKTLIVAYKNASIDLVSESKIFNVPYLKNKIDISNKKINEIDIINDLAYLSCGFGITVLDIDKRVFRDSYYPGGNGIVNEVYDVCTDGKNTLFASTENGIYKANLSDPYLIDFSRWTLVKKFEKSINQQIEYFDNKLFVHLHTPNGYMQDSIMYLEGNVLKPLGIYAQNFQSMVKCSDKLVITGAYQTWLIGPNLVIDNPNTNSLDDFLNYAILDNSGHLWGANNGEGLVLLEGEGKSFYPEGPKYPYIQSITVNNDDLWIANGSTSGTYLPVYNNSGLSIYKNGIWDIQTPYSMQYDSLRDLIDVVVNPNNPEQAFFTSFYSGLLEYNNGKYTVYNASNSAIQEDYRLGTGSNVFYTYGLDFDKQGNLWISNSRAKKPLVVKKKDGKWNSYSLPGFTADYYAGPLLVTSWGHKWVISPLTASAVVFDDNGTLDNINDDQTKVISTSKIIEYLTQSNFAYSLAEDKEGNIWIGTDAGPVVVRNAQQVFNSEENYSVSKVKITLSVEDNTAAFLLEQEKINAIAIDGNNRKWFATENSGVYLMSADALTEIAHFTAENSPLFSNNVVDIAIHPKTGEVLMATDKGLIAYRGFATEGGDDFGDVYVFPNPVRETYSGNIIVTNLLRDADVRITDISGNLVYKTKALGGQAVWDGKNLLGKRVNTGVYLVFCSNEDGSKTFVTKLLFIH